MNVKNNFYRIGQAASLSGVSSPNIRYYEQAGLLNTSPRSENDYRIYDDSDVHLLKFIRLCRSFDIPLLEVKILIGLDLKIKNDCNSARETLDKQLQAVNKKLIEIKRLKRDLKLLRGRCDGDSGQCKIIEALHADAEKL